MSTGTERQACECVGVSVCECVGVSVCVCEYVMHEGYREVSRTVKWREQRWRGEEGRS